MAKDRSARLPTNLGSNAQLRPSRASLILVGRSGVGKTTTGRRLSDLTGTPYLEIGELVRRQAAERGRDALHYAADQFAAGNPLAFVEIVVDEAWAWGVPCIIGGPRRLDELEHLKAQLTPALTIALDLSDDERLRRLRHRKITGNRGYVLAERDLLEEKWGISKALLACDVHISSVPSPSLVATLCLKQWLAFDSGKTGQTQT